jgi:hypothetical protein
MFAFIGRWKTHRTHYPYILIRNLSMRFPAELRIKMNNPPVNRENIQPVFAVDGLRHGEHPTSNIQHPTNCGAFP